MSLGPRLTQTQHQSLVMTPQLQQAIKLLQLSSLDLAEFVESEIERNPLLEHEESVEGVDRPVDESAASDNDSGMDDGPPEPEIDLADDAAFAATSDVDAASEDLYPEAEKGDTDAPIPDSGLSATISGTSTTGASGSGDEDFDAEGRHSREPTLKEHLDSQLMLLALVPSDRIIANQLIDLVDEAGYLTDNVENIAERLGTDVPCVEAVLERLQGFEPTGVFARSLRECLELQLAEVGDLTSAMSAFLENLPLVARHDISGLVRACGVDRDEIAAMAARLKRLNPKPGLQYSSEIVQPVVPDVLVRPAPDGSWLVELNTDTLPKVLIDQRYYATVSRHARSGEEKTYLNECLANARWLVKSLDQRARTVLKVAQEIVRQQDAFLVLGVQHLRPLNLKTIAEAIDMHESTVSRVTANKYMATPRGIFELKYFFTSAIATLDGGASVSAEAVRERIREMIGNESPSEILSDDRLVELLREAGIEIARRTVAKYREGMNIPSSVQRRRLKRAYA